MDWKIPAGPVAKIQIDVEPAEPGRSYTGMHPVVADPRVAIEALDATLVDAPSFEGWAASAGRLVASWKAEAGKLVTSARPIAVQRLCAEIGQALPDDAILVADTGFSTIWSANLIPLRQGQTYLRAAGSLGWAFPASLGAQCAAPDRPVICFTGDGALYYHISELETARRRNLPVVVVVNNNSMFAQGLTNVRKLLKGHGPGASYSEMISFGPTDFARIAEAFGVHGMRVEDPAELGGALRKAIAMRRPVVVDVITDPESRIPEPWQRPA